MTDCYSEKKALIFDSDVGTDDAVAFLMWTLKNTITPDFVISAYGNTSYEKALINTLILKTYLKMNTQLVSGVRPPDDFIPSDFHGSDGFAGLQKTMWDALHLTKQQLKTEFISFDELFDKLKEINKITYIAVGPVTNLAEMLKNPEMRRKIDKIFLMGGGIHEFNCDHETEFNFSKNPDAVKTVLASGLDIFLFPLDLTKHQLVYQDELEKLTSSGRFPEFIELMNYNRKRIFQFNNINGACMHDSMPVLYTLFPEKFEFSEMRILCDEWGHLEENPNGFPVHIAVKTEDRLLLNSLETIFHC